jgi:PPM family protein phosphatase
MSNENPPQSKKEGRELRLDFSVGQETIPSDRHPHENEDAVLEKEDTFGIFDGVGGNEDGRGASRLARRLVREGLAAISPQLSADETAEALKRILIEVNSKVFEESEAKKKEREEAEAKSEEAAESLLENSKKKKTEGSGATASLVKLVEGRRAVVANVGDSRVYVLRGATGRLEQITLDDSYGSAIAAQESDAKARALQSKFNNLTDRSTLSEEEDFFFKNRNAITQALGLSEQIDPHSFIVDLEEGDKILLTSDGVHDNLTDTEIEKILAEGGGAEDLAGALSLAAQEVARGGKKKNERSKMDDISALVVEFSRMELEGKAVTEQSVAVEETSKGPEQEKELEFATAVAATTTPEELVDVLGAYDTLTTPTGEEALIPESKLIIPAVIEGTEKAERVTRYGGLRDKVIALRDNKNLDEVRERLGGIQ